MATREPPHTQASLPSDDDTDQTAMDLPGVQAPQDLDLGDVTAWECDIDSARVYPSPELCQTLALSGETCEITYDEFLERLHPDDRQEARSLFFQAHHQRRPFAYRFRILRADGTSRTLQGHGHVVSRADGDTRILCVGRDITHDPAANEITTELARRNTLVLEATPQGFIVLDRAGYFLDANPAYCNLLGYTREDLLGLNLAQVESSTPGNIQQRLKWTMIDGQMRYETRHRSKSRQWVDVELTVRHAVSDDQEFLFAFVQDIRERRQAREESKRLTTYLQLLLDSAGEGIYSVDLEGHCTFINLAAQQLLGYSRHEALGKDMHELIHHTQPDGPVGREHAAINHVLKSGQGVRVDDEVIWRKNGTSFASEYSSYPIIERGSIAGAVVVFRDVTEARSMAMQLEYQAAHDALTGLANRREFQARLEQALQKAQHEDSVHVLLFLDLDQFKVVNDTSGHAAGDELLRSLADEFKSLIRKGDTLARLGGDEFGVLLENCELDYGLKLAEKFRQQVQDFCFEWEDNEFTVGVSIGVTPVTSGSLNVAALMSAVDSACYSAKDSGRNRVHLFRPDDTGLMRRSSDMRWIGQIHQALKDNRLLMFYQEVMPLSATAERGLHIELLLKMKDLSGKVIAPGVFLPAAERAGLTTDIDRWVVRTSFEWMAGLGDRLQHVSLCSINLSGHSLSDKQFCDFVMNQFERTDIPAQKVCFEVTETAAIANLSNARHLFTILSRKGCQFALDDFGSGMSSYGYLKTLPVDYLKIDGGFVKDMITDSIDYAMVKSINDIGHVLNKKTIAEFVENEEILNALRELGVDYAQGHHINEAQPLGSLDLPSGDPKTTESVQPTFDAAPFTSPRGDGA